MTTSGHTEDCAASAAESHSDLSPSHNDIFCEGCHGWFDEPHVLPNGTDVAGPANWTRERADAWRASHGLSRASDLPAAGPHDKPEIVNDINTAGTDMLPESGVGTNQDMAPGG